MIGNTSGFPVGIAPGVYAFLMVAQSRLWRPGVRRCRWHRVETLDGLPENVPDPVARAVPITPTTVSGNYTCWIWEMRPCGLRASPAGKPQGEERPAIRAVGGSLEIDPSGLTRWKAAPPQHREKEIPLELATHCVGASCGEVHARLSFGWEVGIRPPSRSALRRDLHCDHGFVPRAASVSEPVEA